MLALLSRRNFIKSLAGVASCMLPATTYSKELPVPTRQQLLNALSSQSQLVGCSFEAENRRNLDIAYQMVNPKSHTEAAIVAWAGSQFQFVGPIVEEYCLRKKGLPTNLYDHPVLSLREWCCPETLRILIFQEQLECLTRELTARNHVASNICAMKISLEELKEMLTAPYRGTLAPNDVRELYKLITERYATSRSFSWCSTIVERAFVQKV